MSGLPLLINTREALENLCQQMSSCQRIAVDTEFVTERTYVPRLELVQLASDDLAAVVDFPAVGDATPLVDLLTSSSNLKILHSAYQDQSVLFALTGKVMAPVFDTQVAAAMVGYGAQISYQNLVRRVLGHNMSKTESFTDWSKRPLSSVQIQYALGDVRHLLPLWAALESRLRELGRTEWLEEETAYLTDASTYEPTPPDDLYLSVKGRGPLDSRKLAVLQEITRLREEIAKQRDRQRNEVMRDEVLVSIAQRAPGRVSDLREMRGVYARIIDRHGEEIIAAVHRGLQRPEQDCPVPPREIQPQNDTNAVVSLLQVWVRCRAEEEALAPTLVATVAMIQELVDAFLDKGIATNDTPLALLHGWRKTMVGDDLISILEGRARIGYDPRTRRVTLTHPLSIWSDPCTE